MTMTPKGYGTPPGMEPAWGIATLYPYQGTWTIDEYLDFTDLTNRLVEFTDGRVEVLAMPTTSHQLILGYLYDALKTFVKANSLGIVVFAALRVQIARSKFREPDIVFVHNDRREHARDRFWTAADLVMEVVSDDAASRERDFVQKRAEYATAGIPEYWIVDPLKRQIVVLSLDGDQYVEFGVFTPGQQATSRILPAFAVDVSATFDAAKG